MSTRPAALVTGASRNIGRAGALALARAGYDLACIGRDAEALEETARLVGEAGAGAAVHVLDVTDGDGVGATVAAVAAERGRLDLLVNNAGILHHERSATLAVDDFRRVIETNLVAYFALARAAHPHLKAAEAGAVVNVGSIFGSVGVPGAAAYCAAKAGVEGLTRALAAEWARDGVRVVCVAPGYVETDISEAALADPDQERRILARIPQRRVAQPEEVAELIAFVASPSAAYMSGSTVVLDGGQLAAL